MKKTIKLLPILLSLVVLLLILKLIRTETTTSKTVVTKIVTTQEGEEKVEYPTTKTTHQTKISLTVAESKRLIAKGLLEYPPVKQKRKKGTIILTKGTTNTYVAEEILQTSLTHGEYVLGHILPTAKPKKLDNSVKRKELILKNGTIVNKNYVDVFETFEEGDIIIKGGNLLNYNKKQVGVLIGHPTGGTIGRFLPQVEKYNLHLILAIGLEKETSQDIDYLTQIMQLPHEEVSKKTPTLWSIKGDIFTEIEAIKQFAKVEVILMGSGGIRGAEGATTICIRGEKEEVEKALNVVESIQGEPQF